MSDIIYRKPALARDYAKPLTFEESITNDRYPENVSRALKLQAYQGQALRATIAAAAGEIVQAIDELRAMLNERS